MSHLIGVPVAGVDAAVLVVELHGAGDRLGEGELGGGGDGAGELLPQRLRHVLRHQRVLGLDLGEGVRHSASEIIEDGQDEPCGSVRINHFITVPN